MTDTIIAARPRQLPAGLHTLWSHPIAEIAVVAAWFWSTANRFMFDTQVLYLLTVYFMVGIVLHWQSVVPVIMRGWPILVLPAWAMLSFIWSAVPSESLKISLQTMLTMLICCYIAGRIPQRAFIFVIFCALTYFEIWCIPKLNAGQMDFQGIFTEKNTLALRMSILAFAALVVFLDKGYHQLIRWAAAPIAFIALFMVYRSHSATSILAAGVGLIVILGCAWLWGPAKGYRALLISLAVAAVAGIAMVVLQDPNFDIENLILSKFGKDSTLTGRQELWDYAYKLINEKPFLGLGPGGFWLPERLDAQMLLDTHFKPRGSQFSFHNSYIEMAVYLGYIGLFAGMIGWVWALTINVSRVIKRATVIAAFFAAISLVTLVRSYVESDLWRPFEFTGMIVWIGALGMMNRPPRMALRPAAAAPTAP